MRSICILTDGTAQFTQPSFAGREHIRVLPYSIQYRQQSFPDGEGLRSADLPATLGGESGPRLTAPNIQQTILFIQSLSSQYQDLLVITASSQISGAYAALEKAAQAVRGQVTLTLIDSQTTSVGLGLLVQAAAESAARGLPAAEIERSIRRMATQVYSLFSPAGLTYLAHSGFLDEAQAAIGEMLGLLPIFSIEEGKLSPIEKSRNARAITDHFLEFLGEYENLRHIAILQGPPPFNHDVHLLREHAQIHFPGTPFSEHTINAPVATLFGPRTVGLVLLDTA